MTSSVQNITIPSNYGFESSAAKNIFMLGATALITAGVTKVYSIYCKDSEQATWYNKVAKITAYIAISIITISIGVEYKTRYNNLQKKNSLLKAKIEAAPTTEKDLRDQIKAIEVERQKIIEQKSQLEGRNLFLEKDNKWFHECNERIRENARQEMIGQKHIRTSLPLVENPYYLQVISMVGSDSDENIRYTLFLEAKDAARRELYQNFDTTVMNTYEVLLAAALRARGLGEAVDAITKLKESNK